MLIECPDCGRKVSDRAKACPDCSCPVAEVIADRRAAEEEKARIASRRSLERDVDCPRCEARGFFSHDDGMVEWCLACERTGRLVLCEALDGYYAVSHFAIERFVAGEIHPGSSGVVFYIGKNAPSGHRYPQPAPRTPTDPKDIPW